jgi:hypothetical protein
VNVGEPAVAAAEVARTAVEPVGAELTNDFRLIVVVIAPTVSSTVAVADHCTPTRPEAFATVIVPIVMSALAAVPAAADAGATVVKTPRPNAATATSATRLKVVFVDICFLSISRAREFPDLGLNRISPIQFDESHVLIHQIPRSIPVETKEFFLFLQYLHYLGKNLGFA